jgi:uncharacterized protein with GYD domain
MTFMTLMKLKVKPSKERASETDRFLAEAQKKGVKPIASYYTRGRYDIVAVTEAPDERPMMEFNMKLGDSPSSETLVAVKREDALKLIS